MKMDETRGQGDNIEVGSVCEIRHACGDDSIGAEQDEIEMC